VLVLLNFSTEPAAVKLNLSEEFQGLLTNGLLSDRLNETDIPFTKGESISVDPMSARILTMKKE
jgi:hypothetical protein